MPLITVAFIKRLHTKLLLKALRQVCVSAEQLNQLNATRTTLELPQDLNLTSIETYNKTHGVDASAFGYEDYMGSEITIADLKAELALRPHVPNKQESIALRKEKQNRNRKHGRANR
jgi:hypothetical protein